MSIFSYPMLINSNIEWESAITVTATVTASTETDTTTSTEDVVETDTVSTTVTTILTTTASATSSDAPEKRALSTAPLPACATGLAYSPSQFSSACACVAATPSTTYVTGTAPVATDTSVSTLHEPLNCQDFYSAVI
jgi:hypothetical protein